MRSQLIDVFEHLAADSSVRAVIRPGRVKASAPAETFRGCARGWMPHPAMLRSWLDPSAKHAQGSCGYSWHNEARDRAVNGAAFGLGLDMALACDFIIAAEGAKMSMSFIKRGLVSDAAACISFRAESVFPVPRKLILTAGSSKPEKHSRSA
ncbi:hypothetical protein F2981_28405 (plasmid) [Sinorhizobium meliloti]|nr:hypothetical protein [Sinorhizobium meliloti]